MSEAGSSRVLEVKNWHVLMAFVLWIAQAIWSYAVLNSQTQENTRAIQELRQDRVEKEQFQQFAADMQRRLQRIEDKIDRDRELRAIH